MAELHADQAVTVLTRDGTGRIAATYVGREEDDATFDASTPSRDWHWVQYEEGESEGLTGLFPRSDIKPSEK